MKKISWSWVETDDFRFSTVFTSAYYSLDIEVKYELLFIIAISAKVILDAVTISPDIPVIQYLMYRRSISFYPCNNPMWVSLRVDCLLPHNHSETWVPPISWLSYLSLRVLYTQVGGGEKRVKKGQPIHCLGSGIIYVISAPIPLARTS